MPDLLKKESALAQTFSEERGLFLFYISITIFLASIAVYGGLLLLNNAQERAKKEIIEQVNIKEQSIEPGLINQIFLLDKRLKNMQKLLVEHVFTSNIFKMIEADTHPQVRFLNLNLNADNHQIDMTGETTGYSILARQIALLERDPQIERVEFGGLSLGGNNLLGFKLNIKFKQALTQLKP